MAANPRDLLIRPIITEKTSVMMQKTIILKLRSFSVKNNCSCRIINPADFIVQKLRSIYENLHT